MGIFETLLDDVSLKRKMEKKEITKSKTSVNIRLTVRNKRFGPELSEVEILQLMPSWIDATKKPKEVTVEGKAHKMLVWRVGGLKPREKKTIHITLSGDTEKEGEIGTAHVAYKKHIGHAKKHVYDGYIAGTKKIY